MCFCITQKEARVNPLPIIILIPTHNRISLLERTLDSILTCTPPPDRDIRVIVVENGGCHRAENIVRNKLSWITPEYCYFEQGNKSAALNSIIEDIPDSLLIFLDDDVRVDSALLTQYAKAAGTDSEGRFFGGGLLVDLEEPPEEWLRQYLPLSSTGWHPREHAPMGNMYFFGANWAAFSKDIKKAGGFDYEFGPGGKIGGTGQETAMQQKLIKNGVCPHYVHDALVWHYVPKSRCSPEWALNRAYRTAVTSGYKQYGTDSLHSIAGIPFWLARSTVTLVLKSLILAVYGSSQERFRVRFKLYEDLGSIKGRRQRHLEKRAHR